MLLKSKKRRIEYVIHISYVQHKKEAIKIPKNWRSISDVDARCTKFRRQFISRVNATFIFIKSGRVLALFLIFYVRDMY